MKKILPILALVLTPWIASAVPNSASRSGAAVAMAKVDIGAGTLLAFGGKGTKTSEINDSLLNTYVDIRFTGKYPKGLNPNQITLNVTAQSSTGVGYGVANAEVLNASSTELLIRVWGWKSSDLNVGGMQLFVTAFIGEDVP